MRVTEKFHVWIRKLLFLAMFAESRYIYSANPMRFIKYFTALLLGVLCYLNSLARHTGRGDFYDSSKSYDFSPLWRSDSVLNLEYVDDTFYCNPKYFNFSEPLGFIGNNYQRFYIHFTTVKKNKLNPYQYQVIGKTKVKNNICLFAGIITIDSACYDNDTTLHLPRNIRRGYVTCSCIFREDTSCKNSGIITGFLCTDWCFYKGQLCYDNMEGVSDGYSNNEFEGQWKSYKGNIAKKCNWGNERIPNCGDLDVGAVEFSPDDKYLKNGWQSYRDQFKQTDEGRNARAIECAAWWK